MNDWNRFERLAARARTETAPPVDVTARVLAVVRSRAPRASREDAMLLWFAGASLAAASLVALWALPAWESESNPLAYLLEPLGALLQ